MLGINRRLLKVKSSDAAVKILKNYFVSKKYINIKRTHSKLRNCLELVSLPYNPIHDNTSNKDT